MSDQNLAASIIDFDRRSALVREKLEPLAPGTPGRRPTAIIGCSNLDQDLVPMGFRDKGPRTEDTLTRCQVCNDQVWIGPRARQVQSTGIRVCQLCIATATAIGVIDHQRDASLYLGPNALGIPRRDPG